MYNTITLTEATPDKIDVDINLPDKIDVDIKNLKLYFYVFKTLINCLKHCLIQHLYE